MTIKYTNTDEKSIHLLNDRNISDAISGDGIPKFNAIPSLVLFSTEIRKINDGIAEKLGGLTVEDAA